MRLEKKMERCITITSVHPVVNQNLLWVLRWQWSINVDIMSGKISPLASSYGRNSKTLIMMLTSSLALRRKCYGPMWNGTSVFQRTKNKSSRIGSSRRCLFLFGRSRKTWTKATYKTASPLIQKLINSDLFLEALRRAPKITTSVNSEH